MDEDAPTPTARNPSPPYPGEDSEHRREVETVALVATSRSGFDEARREALKTVGLSGVEVLGSRLVSSSVVVGEDGAPRYRVDLRVRLRASADRAVQGTGRGGPVERPSGVPLYFGTVATGSNPEVARPEAW